MVFNIVKIVNDSTKTVVLTNPLREQDRYVVPAFDYVSENPGVVVPDPPVKIGVIKNNTIAYPAALKEALNIYTLKNNWCFWDSGVKGANDLIGAGEGEDKSLLHLPANTTNLELFVSDYGVPDFRAPSDYQRFLINFKIQAQVRLNWCWAAATASIVNYYEKNESWTPCKVANVVFNRKDCCGVLDGVWCDKGVEFYKALEMMGHLEDAPRSRLSFSAVKKEIDNGRPILAALSSLAGHGVVITGYNNFNPKTRTIEVQDPYGGSKMICDFNTFPGSYGAGYTWVATCRTK
jgi:Papain-like cysteine protease AvrRpt2